MNCLAYVKVKMTHNAITLLLFALDASMMVWLSCLIFSYVTRETPTGGQEEK